MDSEQLNLLRLEVEKTFGRKILTSADCHTLSLDIAQRTRMRISFNTLRRCFNLMRDNHLPSFYTLDVLSNYCGFSSFADFVSFKQENLLQNGEQDKSLLNYLILLFKDTLVTNPHDVTYFSLVHHTINYLEQFPGIVDKFQREIARTTNGQGFYFEQFINIDKLNSFYGEGLRYYLQEKRTREAEIFGNSLLCLRSWLTMGSKDLEKRLDTIMKTGIDHSFEPAVSGRYFATQIYFSEALKLDMESILVKARNYYLFISPSKYAYSSYYCFEIVLSEALLLVGEYEEALFYLGEILEKIKLCIPSYIDVALLETIYLFKAIAYVQVGKKWKAKEIFDNINPNKFYFLSKKYHTILYLSLSRKFRIKQFEQEQIEELIKETGFVKLMQLSKSFDPVTISHSRTPNE